MDTRTDVIRVVIADKSKAALQALDEILGSESRIKVLGQASGAAGAFEMTERLKPDILLIDLALAHNAGPRPLNPLTRQQPDVRAIVTVDALQRRQIFGAFAFGAQGVVLKTAAASAFLQSFQSVLAGEYWMEGSGMAILVEALQEFLSQWKPTMSFEDYGLTQREIDIIDKIGSGHSNRRVSQEFSISERTVKHHLTNIFHKVGVSSRVELALFAVNQHLTADRPSALISSPDRQAGWR
jgi:two-component system, NarL family, nitrate/nitrite response regulator NarL